jgi:putative addiction module component (TIGR02574 family)
MVLHYADNMNKLSKKLYEDSLSLDEAERTSLAAHLLESLEPTDSDAEAKWQKEIERRLSELDSGEVQTIPWESVRAKLSGKLKAVDLD